MELGTISLSHRSRLHLDHEGTYYALVDAYTILKGNQISVSGDTLDVMVLEMNSKFTKAIQAIILLCRVHMPAVIRFFQKNPIYAAIVVAGLARLLGFIPVGRDREDKKD